MSRTLSGAREIGASNITSYRTVNLIVIKYITSSSNVYYVVSFFLLLLCADSGL